MRISDWSSDVCSSDLADLGQEAAADAGGCRGAEVPHPDLRRAGGTVPRPRRQPPEAGLLGSLRRLADGCRRWPSEHLVENLHEEFQRGEGRHHREPTRHTRPIGRQTVRKRWSPYWKSRVYTLTLT